MATKEEKQESYDSKMEDNDMSEDEMEDPQQDQYVEDGFVVGQDEEDPDAAHTKKRKKRRKHRKAYDEELDEDDKDLLRENIGIDVDEKKRKRLKKYNRVKNEGQDTAEDKANQETNLQDEGFIDKSYGASAAGIEIAKGVFPDYEDPKEEKIVTTTDKKQMFTDDEIALKDECERLQEHIGDREKPDETELEQEALWIWNIISSKSDNVQKGLSHEKVKNKILGVLKSFLIDKYDIPYVATYKNYVYEPELLKEDLWKIYELDLEWVEFKKAKNAILKTLEDIKQHLPEEDNVQTLLHSANDQNDLDDIQAYITFYKQYKSLYPKGMSKKKYFSDIREANIDEIFAISNTQDTISLKPHQFYENLKEGKPVHKPNHSSQAPSKLAFKYISKKFETQLKVLIGACTFLAGKMGSFPPIRKELREKYFKTVKINTKPTEKGEISLDVFHPSYRTKRLEGLTREILNDDMWIDILNCQKRGLVEIEYDESEFLTVIDEFSTLFYPLDETMEKSPQSDWYTFHKEAISRMVKNLVKDDLQKALKRDLVKRAEEYVIQKSSDKLYDLLMTPPYQKKDPETKEAIPTKVISMIISSNEDNQKVLTAVSVGGNGDLLQQKNFFYFCMPNAMNNHKQQYDEDKKELKKMITSDIDRPHLLVIGANCLQSNRLKMDIRTKIIEELDQDEKYEPWVAHGDSNQVPLIYANSEDALKNYSQFSVQVRQALSLARYKQSPVSEILRLWNSQNDKADENLLLSLNLHNFQKDISQIKLASSLKNVIVRAVNHIGIDFYRVIDNENLQAPLQFVSGLGPRKANKLVRDCQTQGYKICKRADLFKQGILQKCVYYSASAFLIIKPEYSEDQELYNPIDSTRIHPEYEKIAIKMAQSALDTKEDGYTAIRKIFEDPIKLDELDLDKYSKKMEEAFHQSNPFSNYRSILYFISAELSLPFKDVRGEYEAHSKTHLNDEALFYMMSGESPQTFFKGLLIPANITDIESAPIKCRLENGVNAYINPNLIDPALAALVKPGQVVTAKIEKIEFDKNRVQLACKGENVIIEQEAKDRIDEHYKNFFKVVLDKDFRSNVKNTDKNRFGPGGKYEYRKINFPKFKNITLAKALEELAEKQIGDYVIRPSSLGKDHLTLTWKFFPNVFCHTTIREESKIPSASLGHKLFIGDEQFSNLQEISDMYIKECAKKVIEVQQHHKFMMCEDKKALETALREDKQKAPSIIPYKFTILPDYPNFVVLGYIAPNNKFVAEYIKVKSRGYWFHNAFHNPFNQLIAWFKSNFTDRSYRKYVKKAKSPKAQANTNVNESGIIEPAQPWKNVSQSWQDKTDAVISSGKTPYAAKTEHIQGGGSSWGESAHQPNQQQQKFSAWGQESQVKKESSGDGWGADTPAANSGGGSGWGNDAPQTTQAAGGDWGSGGGSGGANNDGWGGSGDAGGGNDWSGPSNRGGDRGGGRGGGAGGGSGCFKCGEEGHFARECPSAGGGGRGGGSGGGGRGCFKCGEEGHFARECPSEGGGAPRGGGGGGGSRACFKCGEEGHMARECPNQDGGGGGGYGGGSGGGGGNRNCFKCGEDGHMARECPQEGGGRRSGGGGGGGGGGCFKCGQEGHFARECPNEGGGGGDGGFGGGGDSWGGGGKRQKREDSGGDWGGSSGWGGDAQQKGSDSGWGGGSGGGGGSDSGWGGQKSEGGGGSSGWGGDSKPKKEGGDSGWGGGGASKNDGGGSGWGGDQGSGGGSGGW